MGQRVLVRCPDADRAKRLSDLLWSTPRESFLPHALPEHDAPGEAQPVFLTSEKGNPNNATMLMRMAGSDEDTEGFDELIEFFSGLEAEKAAARQRWKNAAVKGVSRRFFIREYGRWVLKKEEGGSSVQEVDSQGG